jgi:hypothetical protein
MKRVIAILFFASCVAAISYGQVNPHAIGLRFGGGDGVGSEISYQYGLNSTNRIEADLGYVSSSTFNRMQITGLYQWVWNIQGALNWYAGVGGGVGQVSIKGGGSEFQLNVNGDIGLEYQLDVPVQISIDLRPGFGTSKFDNSSLALAVRYIF